MKYKNVILMTIFLAIPALIFSPSALGKMKIVYGSDETLVEVKQKDTEWTAVEGADVFTVDAKNGKNFTFSKNGKSLATGTLAAGKLPLKTSEGTFFLNLKFKEEKVKVFPSDGAVSFDIKMKENKVKVKWGDIEYGKVKFYPDNQKMKAKDKDGKEIAVMKHAVKLQSALAAFLIKDLNQDQRMALLLILFAMDR